MAFQGVYFKIPYMFKVEYLRIDTLVNLTLYYQSNH